MALIQFKKGLLANLPKTGKDSNTLYFGLDETNKIAELWLGDLLISRGSWDGRLDDIDDSISDIQEAIAALQGAHKFYEDISLSNIANPKEGNVAIITETKNGIAYRTAYHYQGGQWKAMAGNYNASNVYFDKDLVTTFAMGNIGLTNGQGTVAAKGKNLEQVWQAIYQKETAPTINPAEVTSFSAGPDDGVEVGTVISTISCSGAFTEGSYSFGSVDAANTSTVYSDTSTGIGNPTWTVSYTLKDSNNGAAGTTTSAEITNKDLSKSFTLETGFTVNSTSSKSYATISYEAEWGQSPRIPINNLGTQVSGRIASGTKTGSDDVKITGFRKMFYGTFNNKDTMTSATIRTLTGKKAATGTFDLSIPAGCSRVAIALPSGRSISKVLDVNDSNADIYAAGAFSTTTVAVEGANGFTSASYTVYYLDYAVPADIVKNTYKVTIA